MNWIVDNWYVLLALCCVLAVAIYSAVYFIKQPNESKCVMVKEWLKWAVVEAEKLYQGGTGQIKLRYVYDLFISKFPWMVKVVSFSLFSMWVDDALVWMREQLEKNDNIKGYVGGDNEG